MYVVQGPEITRKIPSIGQDIGASANFISAIPQLVTLKYLLLFNNQVCICNRNGQKHNSTHHQGKKMVDKKKVIVIYHSGYGHTKAQAEAILAGASSIADIEAELMDADAASTQLDKLDEADAMVFGSPTYMGTVSASFKSFMDASSAKWMTQSWKDKIAGGFTNSASQVGDKTGTLQTLSVFAAQHAMIWVGLDLPPGNNTSEGTEDSLNRMGASLGAMAQSLADQGPDVAPPNADHQTAHHYGARIAQATLRWAA